MSVPLHNQIRPGVLVSIVLKQDQRTGRQVQGSVKDVLTRGNHPRGVKVRLADGRIGRVQQLANNLNSIGAVAGSTHSPTQKKYYRKMADHNPWADSGSRQQSHPQSHPQQQQQSQAGGYPQQRFYGDESEQQAQYQQSQYQQPQAQQHPQGYNSAQNCYSEQPDDNAWSDSTGNPPLPQRHPQHNFQQQPVRRDTDDLLAGQEDRGEQIEHMQAYEATARETNDDKDRAQLEKEFPNVDGSLIAALYSDTKDLSATREMLQELARQ